jgi:TrmH family RNA methyltransferase
LAARKPPTRPERSGPRRQLAGPHELEAALRAGEPVRVVLVREGVACEAVERARAAGAVVRGVSARVLHRLSHERPAADVLACVGDPPGATLDELCARGGAAWLLVGVAYPGNAGFAIRTAEVSGADGIAIDCDFTREQRREALRMSMRADWFMPALWESAATVVESARAAGRRVIAIEDVGERAPWQADLRGRVLFAIGGEDPGIPADVLARCDDVLRIPMGGFIRSYNLQAALAMVAGERLRQLAAP